MSIKKNIIKLLPLRNKENSEPELIIFSSFMLFVTLVLFLFDIFFLLDRNVTDGLKISNTLILILIFVSFLFTKSIKGMKRATFLILLISYFIIFYFLKETGGIYSVDTFWAILSVIIAYLFSGVRSGVFFSCLVIIALSFYLIDEKYQIYGLNTITNFTANYTYGSLVCILLIVNMAIFTFVKILNSVQNKNKELVEAQIDELSLMLKTRSRELETLRNKLARDFHDQMGNKIVGIKMIANFLKVKGHLLPEEMRTHIEFIEKSSIELYEDTRHFIFSIDSKNSTLDEVMLHLKSFGEDFFGVLKVDFQAEADLPTLMQHVLPADHVMQLVLIFKEGMTNVGKYAYCNEVFLGFEVKGSLCVVTLKDNGKGYDLIDKNRRINGQRYMAERCKAINATIDIQSETNKGVKIVVQYPLCEGGFKL
ncbi:MAG: hypothetical protein KA313_00475 [Pseudarcicella sp.]|nr:hypothetical protein [Pseudarcicella sp.]MBP6409554.1 hypothetical protein [Pseudarcicella sp.]